MQTALATVVACLEFLALLVWSAALFDLDLAWVALHLLAMLVLLASPLWPSTIVQKFFKGVNDHHIYVASIAFRVPVFLIYLMFFFD